MKLKALIIDDEHLAREVIKNYLKDDESIEVEGECSDGFEGMKAIQEHRPDLIFLDVMMPKLTGFELLELLEDPPLIIFSTAYDQYAINAFEKNAVDYLLKPYSKIRFLEALEKAKSKSIDKSRSSVSELVKHNQNSAEEITRVAVKTGSKIHIIGIHNIKYIESMDDYVRLHTGEGKFLKQNTMKYFESGLPESDFVRVHRSFLVRIKEIARLENMGKDTHVLLLHDGTQLAVSRSGYTRLREVLGI